MKGRKPVPTSLKILSGTRKDRVNRSEPKALPGRPACPDHLDDVAKAKWAEMVGVIEPMGTLTLAEGEALAIYCGAFSRYLRALDAIARDGITIDGGGRKHPALIAVKDAESTMMRIISEFGLTPSSRSKVSGLAEAPKDSLDEFLARHRSKPK
jgi:P27 family predicted phage terminase small subunit